MSNTAVKPFGKQDKLGYMMGDFGCNMSFALINSYMMLFFVTCLGIQEEHFAILILVAKAWDAINDPIIGNLCDRTKPGKMGKFKPWILGACLPLLVFSVVMFIYVPDAPYWLKIVQCLGTYCIWSVAYTSVNVPYGSLQSVITKDRVERAELSNFRSIGAMLAQAPVMILLPLILFDEHDNPKGGVFIWTAAIMGVVGIVAFWLLCKNVTERVPYENKPKKKINYFKTLGAFLSNRPMMALTLSTFSFMALVMTATTSLQYLFMVYFNNTKLISIGTIIMGVPMVFAILLIKPLVKKFSKKQICTYPFAVAMVATGILTFVKITNPYLWLVLFAIAMFASGFFNVLIWAMVADCIDWQEMKTGRREEGSIYATYSLFRKLAQGVGASLVSFALGLTGYVSSLPADQQPAGVGENIRFMSGLLPFIGNVLVFFIMLWVYNIKEEQLAHNDTKGEEEA